MHCTDDQRKRSKIEPKVTISFSEKEGDGKSLERAKDILIHSLLTTIEKDGILDDDDKKDGCEKS